MKEQLDIVDRLRILWTSMTDMGNAEREEAADEIERLRHELTASHESHGNEVGALMERLSLAIHERDEARRRICEDAVSMGDVYRRGVRLSTPRQFAEMMGWDCFKEETTDER